MTIVTIRLCMVYKDRFTINWAIFFLIISAVIGIAVNNLGMVGRIPVIVTIQITICNYICKDINGSNLASSSTNRSMQSISSAYLTSHQ